MPDSRMESVRLTWPCARVERSEQLILIPCLEGLEPDRAMVRLREGFHPIDELLQIGRRTVQQASRIDVQRPGERAQPLGRAVPSRSFLARNDLRPVAVDQLFPAVSLLMMQDDRLPRHRAPEDGQRPVAVSGNTRSEWLRM